MRLKLYFLLLVLLIMTCCAVGPDYQRPGVAVPCNWRLADDQAAAMANTAWWQLFHDPELDRLIVIALNENKDLKIAVAKVEEYLALLGVARSDQFPKVDLKGSSTRSKPSQSGQPITREIQVDEHLGTFNLSFELDIWGRLRRATEGARADLLSKEEAQRTVVITLVSGVAKAYIELRDLDQRLDIAKRTLKSREEALELAKNRHKGGLTSELEVSQAEVELANAATQIPQLEQKILQKENELSVLVGRNPQAIKRGRQLTELKMPPIPAGLPSELLERRPDILEAEQKLVATNARIGEMKAEYFPKISLTGVLGQSSPELSKLFEGPARLWSYGGSLTMPIFQAGKITNQVRAAEARYQQAFFGYEQAIQTAFKEVDDALIAHRKVRELKEAQIKQVKELGNALKLATVRYQNGYTSYLDVLDAQRNLFNAEINLAETQGAHFLTMVSLYKSLGGGWWVDGLSRP